MVDPWIDKARRPLSLGMLIEDGTPLAVIPHFVKSEIVVVIDTEDTKKAKEFAASADLKEAMMKAGVLDTPTIYFLESID
jgi:hypothetical protein